MKIFVEKLGCGKNNIDAELIESKLAEENYKIVVEAEKADIIIVNTCGFIESAKKEAIEYIFKYVDLKEKKPNIKLIVTGCFSQRYSQDLLNDIPEIDGISGVYSYENILDIIKKVNLGKRYIEKITKKPIIKFIPNIKRNRENRFSAELKISDGCNNYCSYCAIPYIRGEYKSKKIEDCIKEAEELASYGVSEIILVGQETTKYGLDLYSKYRLCELIKKISDIDGIKWIRLMYCNLWEINDELLELMKGKNKLLPYIDVPIQNANDRILKLMNRKGNYKEIIEKINYIKKYIPKITIRSTLITGFPGETKEEFEHNVKFLENARLDRVGVFKYSHEYGTKAFEMEDNINNVEKERRFDILMSIQQKICYEKNRDFVGKELDVIVEGKDNGFFIGRSYRDAPEIDGFVIISSDKKIQNGDFVKVNIKDFTEYDLIGELV
ncbi:MAG: 30S ribosomal protein S12 methylthiotransferase RimO [Candidatus Muirbacterium halophilum]|nr:30S ribosomal protein S12 methylthiotransferase RimO [Candidatus Muirbacterium halophilum]MCK9476426.1 30S ribosomal protein S12 methylthiotransferase RimO [Candidatus Muirbacterium halophilum]